MRDIRERAGGAAFLARTLQSVPNYAHASYYAQVVRQKATYRALIDASTEEALSHPEVIEVYLGKPPG